MQFNKRVHIQEDGIEDGTAGAGAFTQTISAHIYHVAPFSERKWNAESIIHMLTFTRPLVNPRDRTSNQLVHMLNIVQLNYHLQEQAFKLYEALDRNPPDTMSRAEASEKAYETLRKGAEEWTYAGFPMLPVEDIASVNPYRSGDHAKTTTVQFAGRQYVKNLWSNALNGCDSCYVGLTWKVCPKFTACRYQPLLTGAPVFVQGSNRFPYLYPHFEARHAPTSGPTMEMKTQRFPANFDDLLGDETVDHEITYFHVGKCVGPPGVKARLVNTPENSDVVEIVAAPQLLMDISLG